MTRKKTVPVNIELSFPVRYGYLVRLAILQVARRKEAVAMSASTPGYLIKESNEDAAFLRELAGRLPLHPVSTFREADYTDKDDE